MTGSAAFDFLETVSFLIINQHRWLCLVGCYCGVRPLFIQILLIEEIGCFLTTGIMKCRAWAVAYYEHNQVCEILGFHNDVDELFLRDSRVDTAKFLSV